MNEKKVKYKYIIWCIDFISGGNFRKFFNKMNYFSGLTQSSNSSHIISVIFRSGY
jgi:hypothetical protein